MDIVICIALKDILFFNKNLYFIKENLKPSNLYIITDTRNFKYIKKDKLITLINENELIEDFNFYTIKKHIDKHLVDKNYGWYFQQFLKLGFALSKYATKEYLIWDADTIPFNSIVFKENNYYLFLPKTEHHEPYFITIDKLFNAPQKANYSFIAEHMIFNVNIVKEMLSLIEKNTQMKWYEACIYSIDKNARNGFSEFETYGTYCLNYHPGLYKPRHLYTFRKCGKIFGIFASINQIKSLEDDLDTGSFEGYDYPNSFMLSKAQWFYYKTCKLIMKIRRRYPKWNFI